jgi:hypothetical protein
MRRDDRVGFWVRRACKSSNLRISNTLTAAGAGTKERPSEAFATGQSLYALGRAGVDGKDAAFQRAWAFLAATQKPGGSWQLPSRKPNVKDNPIAVYWGTAWATIGLARTVPEK